MSKPEKASHRVRPEELFSRVEPAGRGGRILQFPLARIVVAAIFLLPALGAAAAVVFLIIERMEEPWATVVDLMRLLAFFVLLIGSYRLYCAKVERREAAELGFSGSVKETGAGVLLGAGIVVLMVALIALGGWYRVEEVNSPLILASGLILFGTGAFLQELVFRGVLFRLAEELAGSWIALLLVAALFGLVHLGNPNATPLTSAALAAGDLMLTAAFMLTRRLWMVWGIHFGWNFAQAGVFGMPNSGITFEGLLDPVIEGPAWLTGGSFGIEASLVCVALTLLVGLVLIGRAVREGQIVRPAWTRHADRAPSPEE